MVSHLRDIEATSKETNKVAEAFVNRFYRSMDTNRHKVHMLYMPNAVVVWNGNRIEGLDTLSSFFTDTIPSSNFTIDSYDAVGIKLADPLIAEKTGTRMESISICVAGIVKFKSNPGRTFHDTFLIGVDDFNWKIESEAFRFSD
ncbi:hypothetical protein ACOME3_005805 [Neoechinorhynchus agilis]